eukprot:CAMPEP_0177603200 /NCGR_PEP_ID=MMETSP0419_2-20121207/15361_1 /TAXON_ID=582737 /ORGANISM="Tetraselmis sp., Strain GSL018" /LENGTH=364 /DNA_ID=CAMNT_0019096907 /DNA_START=1437 /DNA_END=2530 /DNA_ORIENTATION=-
MGLRFAQGLRRTARLLHCRVSPYPESLPVRMGSMTELTGAGHEWQRHMDSSAHQQELVVLYTCIFLWCSPEGTSAVSFSVLYASRLLAAGLLLLTRDRGYSVCAMRSQGAALGLLMDARRLARAIQGHLAGRPPAGPVPAYKATVLRMHRTLAVSYRWQPEEREVAEGVSVNMSDFQLRSLAAAVRSSGCDYVWIDKLAVPQDGGEPAEDDPVQDAGRLLRRPHHARAQDRGGRRRGPLPPARLDGAGVLLLAGAAHRDGAHGRRGRQVRPGPGGGGLLRAAEGGGAEVAGLLQAVLALRPAPAAPAARRGEGRGCAVHGARGPHGMQEALRQGQSAVPAAGEHPGGKPQRARGAREGDRGEGG